MTDDSFKQSYVEGINVFQSARRKAFWHEMLSLLRGQSAELMSFDDIKARLRLREESYRGLQNVPLDKIVGSVGRYRDFTSSFLPKKTTSQERWSRVYAQVSSMEGTPPIELYKVGDVYFVRDGNHRVSVARQIGARTIEAHVTELPTSVELEPGMSSGELDAATAYAAFLEETGYKRTRPHHQSLKLSNIARYPELLGHIHLHQSVMERVNERAVSFEEAAADWYDNVYRPAVTLIRKYNILEIFPDRTEADLYLWMVDHLREVREEFGDETDVRTFSDALVDFLREHNVSIPKDLLIEDDPTVNLTRSQVMRAVQLKREEEQARGENGRSAD